MNDGRKKLHTGYLLEGLELFICKVAYTMNDATSLVPWSNYTLGVTVDHPEIGDFQFPSTTEMMAGFVCRGNGLSSRGSRYYVIVLQGW
jgi:hypothetical protein